MFGSLASRYFRRARGSNRYRTTYKTRGLRRFAPKPRYRRRRYSSANRVFSTFHRLDSIAALVQSNTSDQTGHLSFNLGQCPGSGPYQNLYHQYRIVKVKLQFIPCNMQSRFNLADPEKPTDTFTPSLYTSINRTSTAFANNVSKIMSMNSCRYTLAGRTHSRTLTPSSLDQVYESSVTTAYAPEYKQWLSTDDPTVPHFGLDYVLAGTTSEVGAFKYRLVQTVWLQYKNRKPNTDVS